MKQREETNKKKSSELQSKSLEKENVFDSLKPSDWFFQISLIIAVTSIVCVCIFGVAGKINLKPENTHFEFPIYSIQKKHMKNKTGITTVGIENELAPGIYIPDR